MPASPYTDPFEQLSSEDQTLLKALVWQVLRNALIQHQLVLPPAPTNPVLLRQGACFVTLYVDEQLRGCTGSIEACSPLWMDVCKRSYTSTQDSRFPPLQLNELSNLTFKISILTPLKAIRNQGETALMASLTPQKDGLLLRDTNRQAVFLPTVWQSLPQPKQFIAALKHKGGWPTDYWSEQIRLYRFYTVEYDSTTV